MHRFQPGFIQECKTRLLTAKSDLLNRIQQIRKEWSQLEHRGDEADQSVGILAENEFLRTQNRLQSQLYEIESALARIEAGHYGVCEETEELIEMERLRTIPWTRVSIEGAEVRESLSKRFAYSR